ncbi:GNAT family N-acetyltransferase [Enterobacteriaceae bacterium H20N1]|uniref:GNAT family N-acetyltransferase n=1 Tax=Dryocola boscaweniae TaxID=2925397 RepID=A0A9X3AE78_9ENTR|nr:GNAT family N-acetyltransferase [Dryocola boscaweniae]MCT4703833.1 GNAT family N-acetyltransferase [Dryocola boscaweniae]MCT4717010.1 GNAT family N-acetyltransferase [Dryocola boscaweniae]MCT4721001.1 GNAT family N-acetyltransferase [Dryocola boscaweniae]
MKVRLALPHEAQALWNIRNRAIRHGCRESYDADVIAAWTPELMPETFPRVIVNNPFFVVDDPISNSPAATGFLDLACGSVEAVFTLPAFLGQGMASRILQAIKEEAVKRGFTQLTLSSTPNACEFYERNGFTLIQEALYPSSLAGTSLRCMEMVCVLPLASDIKRNN